MRTSFHTATLHELPVLEAVDTLTAAGYDAVELNAEALPWAEPHVGPDTPADIRAQLRARGVVGSIAAHRADLANPAPEPRAEAVAWTIGCIELARDIGASIIHVIPGDQPDVAEGLGVAADPGDLDAFTASLNEIVRRGEELGIVVALEPIVNQLVDTTDQALEVLDRVPGLKISFDPSHLQVTTHDVGDAARRLGPYVVIVALKDATGVREDFKFLAPGEGEIDFPAMLNELRAFGFDGDIVVEHEAHLFGDPRGPKDVVNDSLAAARSYRDSVVAAN
jgi:sugar phosphate isomerase/epimerase